ncbi:hypothetical protein APSETT445_005532 [Aspergillus pseudonomiae]
MDYLDRIYDPTAAYVFSPSAATALRHDTRASVWYAVGLLARNQNDDVAQAMAIIQNVIEAQFKDPTDQWYGDYPVYPEEPTVGTAAYQSSLYDTWDPNWRGFIGTAFIIALEEFPHLVSPDVTQLMLESLYNSTIGDSYRVGGVDGDNLYPSYTNPALMRAIVSGWTGKRYADANMTLAGEHYANEIIDLFDRANTLSEFNSATYTGVSLIALTMWTKYAAESSVMKAKGKEMLQATWRSIGDLYHAELKNLAGPWDRSYGFDMQKYFGIMSAHIWTLVGKETSPVIDKLYATEKAIDAVVGPGYLNLTYPQGTPDSQFQFLVSPFTQKKDVAGWEDLVGLDVRVSGTFDSKLRVSYSASDATIKYVA